MKSTDRPGLIRRHSSLACHAQMAQPLAPAPSAQVARPVYDWPANPRGAASDRAADNPKRRRASRFTELLFKAAKDSCKTTFAAMIVSAPCRYWSGNVLAEGLRGRHKCHLQAAYKSQERTS